MNRIDQIIDERAKRRLRIASESVPRLIDAAKLHGIEMTVVGSLAKGRFRVHSDIDLLVKGKLDAQTRALAERIVADHLGGTDLPYDLVFADDLEPSRLQEILDDLVPPSGLRETRLQDRPGRA